MNNGKGKLFYKNGNIKYEGSWVDKKAEGNGIFFYENGDYYIGEFKNGEMNGKGKLYFKNGNIKFEGNFLNNKYEGNLNI